MFGRRKEPTFPAFLHTDDCKIFKTDPGVELNWSEIRRGAWEARCVCGIQYHYEDSADRRVRLDPFDPSTGGPGRHFPQCEHRDTTDPAVLRLILRVKDVAFAGGDYFYVTCGACEAEWQVAHYAESVT